MKNNNSYNKKPFIQCSQIKISLVQSITSFTKWEKSEAYNSTKNFYPFKIYCFMHQFLQIMTLSFHIKINTITSHLRCASWANKREFLFLLQPLIPYLSIFQCFTIGSRRKLLISSIHLMKPQCENPEN